MSPPGFMSIRSSAIAIGASGLRSSWPSTARKLSLVAAAISARASASLSDSTRLRAGVRSSTSSADAFSRLSPISLTSPIRLRTSAHWQLLPEARGLLLQVVDRQHDAFRDEDRQRKVQAERGDDRHRIRRQRRRSTSENCAVGAPIATVQPIARQPRVAGDDFLAFGCRADADAFRQAGLEQRDERVGLARGDGALAGLSSAPRAGRTRRRPTPPIAAAPSGYSGCAACGPGASATVTT